MTDITETPWDGEGPPPIYEADRLLQRIGALDAERKNSLAEAWGAQGIGEFKPGLVTADRYRQVEKLVQAFEPSAPADFAHVLVTLHENYVSLPDHIKANAAEAMGVYAGMEDPTRWVLTSTGRLEEVQRIVKEALDYTATLHQATLDKVAIEERIPSVSDLPPADDTALQVASNDYPGAKADAKTVLAWVNWPADNWVVGTDVGMNDAKTARLNRAAIAYAEEQRRATTRKGVSAKLIEILGPDGLATVNAALAAAEPPPLVLDAGLAPSVDEGAVGDVVAHPPTAASDGQGMAVVDAAPTAPVIEPLTGSAPLEDIDTAISRRAELYRQLSDIYAELAGVS
jgi:hypothetical protein